MPFTFDENDPARTLDDWIIRNREASFIMRVTGNAMQGAGICDGDFMIVERTAHASVGSVVVAKIDEHWVLRYLRRDRQGYYLESASPDHHVIRPANHLSITAIVTAVVRKYYA